MALPPWLYDWLHPTIPENARLRSRNNMNDPESHERVLRMERNRYNHWPPRYSMRWCRNAILLPITTPIAVFRMCRARIPYYFEGLVHPIAHYFFFVKVGRNYEAEISAMRMLRAQTTIPVPRPLIVLPWGRRWYIVMTQVPGVELEDVWLAASNSEKENYVQQLGMLVRQLRRLRSPFGSRICSADGRDIWDPRLRTYWTSGPFDNEYAFNQAVILQVPLPRPRPSYFGHNITHRVTFTHSDFARRNIMVRDGQVTGIVDWETAGWYPAHWEYVKSHLADWWEPWELWAQSLPKMVPSFETEWEFEAARIKDWIVPLF